jgi:hypothetical protein
MKFGDIRGTSAAVQVELALLLIQSVPHAAAAVAVATAGASLFTAAQTII